MIIVFEGSDHVGKTTQAKLLADKLPNSIYQKSPFKTILDGDRSYNLIYEWLNHGRALKNPLEFQKMFVANRNDWISNDLPLLQSNYDYIILDRWSLSTWIYGLNSGININELKKLIDSNQLKIDLQFIFTPSDRVKNQKDSFENDGFQFKIRQHYSHIIERIKETNKKDVISCLNARNIVIDSNRSIDEINLQILQEITKYKIQCLKKIHDDYKK